MSFTEGAAVGQYRIIKTIGSGGMATVYLAEHEKLDRQVAIKIMHDSFSKDVAFRARFEREAQIVAKLDHPNIIPVYDYSDIDGQPYLIMKYIDGISLRQHLRKSPLLSIDEIFRLMNPIADALTYAHNHGILHRDIKPSNIMLDKQNTPYLADFGLARIALAGESTLSQDMILGTPQYISPEQAKGVKAIDGRADVYSLGIVLYQLFVGDVPFAADTPFAIIHDHIYRPIPKPSEINPELSEAVEAVLVKALQKKPEDRYETANDLIAALQTALQDNGLTELNQDHLARAATSIAVYREQQEISLQTEGTPTPTPPPADGTITPSRLSTASYSTEYDYQRAWMWVAGGLLGFIVFLGLVFGQLGQLDEITNQIQHEMDFRAAQQERLEIIERIPDLTPSQAEALAARGIDRPVQYLAVARTYWETAEFDKADTVIQDGAEQVEALSEYYWTVVELAAAEQQVIPILVYNGHLLNSLAAEAQSTDIYPIVRNDAGARLYNIVTDQRLTDNVEIDIIAEQVHALSKNPLSLIMLARALETVGRSVEAQDLQNRYDDPPKGYEAEYFLVLSDITADAEAEQTYLEQAQDADNAPEWVIAEAESRLDAFEN